MVIVEDLKNYSYRKGLIVIVLTLLFSVGFHLTLWYRLINILNKYRLSFLYIPCSFFLKLIFKCDINAKAKIGKRVTFVHPFGIVIGEDSILGNDVTIYQQVTIGSHGKKNCDREYPIIGNKVKIYAGAKILGAIKIGDNVIIGANSVVLKDIPSNTTVAGVPAKIIKSYNE